MQGKTPNVAVIGCGQWGKNHVRNFSDLGALASVTDPDVERATALSREYDVPVREFDGILGDQAIGGVVIAAPADQHYALAKTSLLAGKHVFVEKPLALDVAEGEELCEIAEANNRVLMVGHLLQYHPAFIKLKEIVFSGRLGRIQYINSNRLNFGQIRTEEDILWSFAPHDISMTISLLRETPNKVAANGAAFLHKEKSDVTTTHLSFPGGQNAQIFVSWLHPFKEHKMVVVGDKGMAAFDDSKGWDEKLTVYPHVVLWRDGKPIASKADIEKIKTEKGEPLRLECAHFLECIATGATPRTDGREGLEVLRILEASARALSSGNTVHLSEGRKNKSGGFESHETAVIDPGADIGDGTRIWHFSHIMKDAKIGRNCVIGQNVMVGSGVIIGDNCKLQNNVSVYQGVHLENGVFCGPSAVFTNVLTPRSEVDRKDEFMPTLVRKGATIGANATIVCGNTIGAYSTIGAGAVVCSDVPDHALMVGVPARRMGWVSHDGERMGDDLICPRSGRRYGVSDGQLREISEQ